MSDHQYLAFGLTIESAWPISSLEVSEDAFPGGPDVQITEGAVRAPDELQNIDGLQVSVQGRSCFLAIDQCGRFQVSEGRSVVVEPDAGASREQVNLYLLGSVFGALLHQRGMLPFHCNAVELQGSTFLFCGDSGAGKSTLAAYFIERGFRLLSDDLCALSFDTHGRLVAAPGAARLKLWEDTLQRLGRSAAGLRLVPWYDDKFEVPLMGPRTTAPLPVAGIYHLRTAEDGRAPGIHPLSGLEAVNAVTANIYRRRLADLMGAAPSYLRATAQIVTRVPIFSMNRNWGFENFREEAGSAEDHLREIVRQPIGPLERSEREHARKVEQ